MDPASMLVQLNSPQYIRDVEADRRKNCRVNYCILAQLNCPHNANAFLFGLNWRFKYCLLVINSLSLSRIIMFLD